MPRLSIILPTYNSMEFLQKIFDSLQNQTERDLEIIFVNDGSTDSSSEICHKFATQDSRIIVKDKENGGVSSARNSGLECTTGKFVTFLDPDDYIDKEMYSNMLKCTDEETDIVISGFIYEYADRNITIKMPQNMKTVYKGNDIYTEVLSKFILYGKGLGDLPQMGTVWRMIFRREFLQKNDLKFLPFVNQDDLCFALSTLRKANSIAIEKGAYYHYIIRKNSITQNYNPKCPEDCKRVLNKLKDNGVFDFIPKQYENNPGLALFFLIFTLNRIVLQKKSLFAIRKELKEIFDFYYPDLRKIHINKCTGKHKLIFILLKFKLLLFLLFIFRVKNNMY